MLLGTVIHTPTPEDFIEVVEYSIYNLGLVWSDESDDVGMWRYHRFKKDTCVRIYKHIRFASYDFYKFIWEKNVISTDEFFHRSIYTQILKEFR